VTGRLTRPVSTSYGHGMSEGNSPTGTSDTLTEGVRVKVRSAYSPEHSDPAQSQWFFLYTITIANEGPIPVQLESRHWIITDGTGHIEEVRGPGVVGAQPELDPGEDFEYTSGCPLATPFGSMEGTFRMIREDQTTFNARISRFELREPRALH
jgi:ApaG protein